MWGVEHAVSAVLDRDTAPFAGRPGPPALERLLALRPRLTWDAAAVLALMLLGAAVRFWDLGDRAIHHDESLHATFSWYFYRGQGYTHDPLMHGPFLFHAMALVYGLFGLSDATSRFVPVVFGSALIGLPWLLRGRLGRAGTVAAAALIAVSPTLLYYSRFVGAGAQDIVLAVMALLIVAGCWRYLDDGRPRSLYLVAGALCLGFATKEVTFILAVIFLLWLDGLAAHDLAAQTRGRSASRRLWTLALMPVAWAVTSLWPALRRPLARHGITRLPRSADLLLVLGLLTAPQFAAAVQVPLGRLGYAMDAPSRVPGLTNEELFGGATVGLLLIATTLAGLAWRRREFLICAAIFWAIYILLFTTFFTNIRGFATGIWGSLDYWLEQQGEERGKQPVFYYAMLTPVYEYLALILASWGIVRAALRGGWSTALALPLGGASLLLTAAYGHGDLRGAPGAVLAVLALVTALRRDPFRSFLAFWAAAVFFGLSVAGEKMPWLEVHIALPLALLGALTVEDLVAAARTALRRRPPDGARAAARAARPLRTWAPLAAAAGGLALAALLLLPLTVRDGLRASFVHADTPRDMLIYTQTSPELKQLKQRVDRLARESGLGYEMPIIVDGSHAFTWPWAWYLRDYRNTRYVDLEKQSSAQLAGSQPGMVLFASSINAHLADAWPDYYAPGEPYAHRWWFPEDGYRTTTAPRFWQWLRDPAMWRTWKDFFLDRRLREPIGSIDGVAFFPAGSGAPDGGQVLDRHRPRASGDRLVVGGAGNTRGALSRPAGVAVDAAGNVYVADSLNHRVQKFDLGGELVGATDRSLGLREPWGVAVDGAGRVYVADTWNHRIVRLTRDLRLDITWGRPDPPEGPPGPLNMYGPRAVAVDADGNVWVTDTGHNRVLKFTAEGAPLEVYGGPGGGPGQFQEPVGLAIAPSGEIVVADAWNGRVQRFDPGFSPLGEFRVEGWEDRNVENKPYLTVLPDGSILCSVPEYGRIERLAPDGRRLSVQERFGEGGTGARPLGVAVDFLGRLWVAESAASQLIRLPAP